MLGVLCALFAFLQLLHTYSRFVDWLNLNVFSRQPLQAARADATGAMHPRAQCVYFAARHVLSCWRRSTDHRMLSSRGRRLPAAS